MTRTAAPPWSLRKRLLGLLVLLVGALFVVGALQSLAAQRRASQQLIDASLRESGLLLLQLAEHEIEEHGLSLGVQLMKAETNVSGYQFRYQIWTEDMRSAYRSAGLPATPLMDVAADGFGDTVIDGDTWRTFAAWNANHTLQIQIAQADTLRRQLDRRALLHTGGSLVLLLAVALALMWWIVGLGIRPLQQAADGVAQRSPDDLRPVEVRDAPLELAPILAALNRLLGRVQAAFVVERRFTADAAHELRTPLAAIRTGAQALLGARDESERAELGADLLTSVNRGTRVVEQLLVLARADAQAIGGGQRSPVDLGALVSGQVALHAEAARRQHIALIDAPGQVRVNGVPALLEVLLRNLLDNALRYTPPGGEVAVACGVREGSPFLEVRDTGPGIPAAERLRVFERFYRLPGSRSSGSGLGLSIVQRIAELHGAEVTIEDGAGGKGTCVRVRFPASAEDELSPSSDAARR